MSDAPEAWLPCWPVPGIRTRTRLAALVQSYESKVRLVARVLLGPALRPYLDSVDLVQSVHRSLMLGLRQDKFDISSPEKLMAAGPHSGPAQGGKWRHLKR